MEPQVDHAQQPADFSKLLKPSHATDQLERRFMRHAAAFVAVVGHRGRSFLVFFSWVEDHTAALAENRLSLRGLELKLIHWSRRVQASFFNFCFRARLCLEGIPRHAWSGDTASIFLADGCILDKVDDVTPTEKEAACLCVWAWVQEVNCIPKSASLLIAEPHDITSPPPAASWSWASISHQSREALRGLRFTMF
ncbi:hypothetical protein ABZP36_016893 [Zizania latifolia]